MSGRLVLLRTTSKEHVKMLKKKNAFDQGKCGISFWDLKVGRLLALGAGDPII